MNYINQKLNFVLFILLETKLTKLKWLTCKTYIFGSVYNWIQEFTSFSSIAFCY